LSYRAARLFLAAEVLQGTAWRYRIEHMRVEKADDLIRNLPIGRFLAH
jgi:hypothetical protein